MKNAIGHRPRHAVMTVALVLLFLLDVGSDVACAVELFLNDHFAWSGAVLSLVLLPAVVAVCAELIRACLYSGCCGEASTDWIPLIFYHVYTLILLIGSGFNYRWAAEANYLRAIQGFVQAGLQLILQLYLVYKGVLVPSLRDVMKTIFEHGWRSDIFADRSLHWYWGLIQAYSIILSFVSVVQTTIQFNEWPKRRHTFHRLVVVVPHVAATLFYRLLAISLLTVFAGQLTLVPVIVLLVGQAVTLNSLGLDLARSLAYALTALLVPVGYSRCRDPDNQPYGLTLLPEYVQSRQMHFQQVWNHQQQQQHQQQQMMLDHQQQQQQHFYQARQQQQQHQHDLLDPRFADDFGGPGAAAAAPGNVSSENAIYGLPTASAAMIRPNLPPVADAAAINATNQQPQATHQLQPFHAQRRNAAAASSVVAGVGNSGTESSECSSLSPMMENSGGNVADPVAVGSSEGGAGAGAMPLPPPPCASLMDMDHHHHQRHHHQQQQRHNRQHHCHHRLDEDVKFSDAPANHQQHLNVEQMQQQQQQHQFYRFNDRPNALTTDGSGGPSVPISAVNPSDTILAAAGVGGGGDSMVGGGECGCCYMSGHGDRTPEQVECLRHRTKSYLAMHVILGGGVLGLACAIVFLLLNFTTSYEPLARLIIFDRHQLNGIVFPSLAFAYLAAVLLTGLLTCCIGRCFDDEYVYPV